MQVLVAMAELAFHADPSVWVGGITGNHDGLAQVRIIRASAGLELRDGDGVALNIAPVLDLFVAEELDTQVFDGDSYGLTVGVAVHADWPAVSCWRIGPRGSFSVGEGDGANTGDGRTLMFGVHARNRRIRVGFDVLHVDGDRESGTGFLVGAGLDGRAGRYGMLGVAGAAVIGGIIAVAALANANTH